MMMKQNFSKYFLCHNLYYLIITIGKQHICDKILKINKKSIQALIKFFKNNEKQR